MTQDVTFPDIGRRLCAARVRRGLSQGTVARMAGIGSSYLSRIENGRIQPSFRTVVRVQRAINADLDELAGPEPDRRRRGPCPITGSGSCLLDLIRAADAKGESYTPRQVRLLRSVASWARRAPPDRLRAMEILVEDLSRRRPSRS
jgi:transcriptional regulator with XRE-family HTH domain